MGNSLVKHSQNILAFWTWTHLPPTDVQGKQYGKYSSKNKVGKVCYENKYYLCRKDFDTINVFV